MNQFNHLHIAGNLTHAPEVKTYNGRSYCSFQIANTRSWKDQNDEEKSAINFIPVTARGAVADLITPFKIAKPNQLASGTQRQLNHFQIPTRSTQSIFLFSNPPVPPPIHLTTTLWGMHKIEIEDLSKARLADIIISGSSLSRNFKSSVSTLFQKSSIILHMSCYQLLLAISRWDESYGFEFIPVIS